MGVEYTYKYFNMINNVIPIRIAEENRSTCLNYLVLKSPGLEPSAFKIQTIKKLKIDSERSKFILKSN